jgi:post-segregation antitoxin (ccd killing protein)
MRREEELKPHTIRVPDELWKRARKLSIDRDEPLSPLIVKWLTSWVKHHEEGK